MLKFQSRHASFETRNAMISNALTEPTSWVLDVGSNFGFTGNYLASKGHVVLGIEKMEKEYREAKRQAHHTSATICSGVNPQLIESGPKWDAILLLSVLHRLYAYEGEAFMRSVFSAALRRTDILFVEGSTRHARYTDAGQPPPDFEDGNIQSAADWHEAIFAETLTDGWQIRQRSFLPCSSLEPYRIYYRLEKTTKSPTTAELESPPRAAKTLTVRINPKTIKYLNFPESFMNARLRRRRGTGVREGNWDSILARRVYWSGRYEYRRGEDIGLVPLANFAFFQSLTARFLYDAKWEDTDWYKWLVENSPRRYATEAQRKKRLQFLDKLFEMAKGGSYEDDGADLPKVNIGRDDRIAIEDGRHRICVAILAGVPEIDVSVRFIHPEADIARLGLAIDDDGYVIKTASSP